MSIDSPTETWSLGDRQLIADFLDEFSAPGIVSHAFELVVEVEVAPSSTSTAQPADHESIERLWRAICHSSCWVSPYEGDNWSEFWGRYSQSPSGFTEASVTEIRRFLALATRGERFCEGLMANLIDKGVMHGALARLRVLNENEAIRGGQL